MITNKLFHNFNKIDTQVWEDLIYKDLKGADYKKKLLSNTIENITIKPYYRKENLANIPFLHSQPGFFPYVRGNNYSQTTHKIRQNILVKDFYKSNFKSISLIEKGVTSLGFDLQKISTISKQQFSVLLKDINLNTIEINFLSGQFSELILDFLIDYISQHYQSKDNISCSIDFDPLGYKTIYGNFYKQGNDYKSTLQALFIKSKDLPNLKILNVNASIFRNAGSSAVQELAYALSIGSEYLSAASEFQINIEELAPKIMFTFGIGSNYFMEIAKIRAARFLWAKIVESYGVKNSQYAKMFVHSITSDWNKTAYDPYVNVLRTTTEAMSAIVGGTDSLLVKPFNSSFEDTNDFSERIARNTQIILNEEAYFDKFIDPAAGSYYIENLTNSLIENAWDLFLEIDKQGAYNSAFDKGFVKKDIEQTAAKRDMAIAMKKEVLLGTNQYAAREEKLNITIPKRQDKGGNTIKIYRAAEAFEELRQRTESAKITPKVLLLSFGKLTMRKARASFATNFFACAGFEIIELDFVNTPNEGIKQFYETNADITVLCSSDDEYFDFASEIYKEIADKTILTIAGYPKKNIEDFKTLGIENFIHVKSNILETLTKFQNIVLSK